MILILGGSGFIGNHLYNYLQNKQKAFVVGTYCKVAKSDFVHFDLTRSSTEELLDKYQIKFVILSAESHKKLDDYKKHWNEAYHINVYCLKKFIDSCFKREIFPIHISTDNVFDGFKGNYKEDDVRNPITCYGEMRYKIENHITEASMPFAILRMGSVFGVQQGDGTIVTSLYNKIKQTQQVLCAADQVITPIFIGDLISFISNVIEKDYEGVFHIASTNPITRYEIAKEIVKYLKIDKNLIKPCKINSLNILEKRPLNLSLDITKYKKLIKFSENNVQYYLKMINNLN